MYSSTAHSARLCLNHVTVHPLCNLKELQASYRYLAEIVIYSIGQQGKLLSLAANNL